jgi:hypothetical protein
MLDWYDTHQREVVMVQVGSLKIYINNHNGATLNKINGR